MKSIRFHDSNPFCSPPSRTRPSRFRAIGTSAVLAFVVFLTTSCGASVLDLFRSSDPEQKGEKLRQAYGEAAFQESQGKNLAAIEALERCVRVDPESIYLRARLAEAYLNANRPDDAERTIKPLVKEDSVDAQTLRIQARIALQRQQFDQAVQLYEASAKIQPGNLIGLQALAVLYYEHLRDLQKTIEVCDRILRIDGRNLHALLYNAEASAMAGDIEKAADLYERLLRHHQTFIDRLDELAQKLVNRGRSKDALFLYRRGVLVSPRSDILKRGFETLAGEGDTTATLEAYRSLTEEAPSNLDIRRLYAERLMQSRRWDDSEAEYRKILDLYPNDVSSHIALAEITLQKGDIESALKRFEEALQRHPTDPEVYSTVARLYLLRGDLKRAEQLLVEAEVYGENDPTVLVLLADVYERTQRPEEAESHLKRALDAMPANPTLLGLLATFYARNNRGAEAAEVMEQMIAVRPRDLSLYDELLSYYLKNDRKDAVRMLIQRGRKTFEDSMEFDILVAQVSLRHDEITWASDSLKRVLKTNPASLDARILLSHLHLSIGEGEQASQVLEEGRNFLANRDETYAWRLAGAGIYMERRMWKEAVEQFVEAQKINPDEYGLYPGYVESLIKAGRVDEGVKVLNEAVRQFTIAKPKEVQLLRAQSLVFQKQYDRAQRLLTSLSSEYPDDYEILFNLGALYGEIGNLDEAEKAYRKVIEIDPAAATAYNNLGYLLAQSDTRLDEAETLVKKALEIQPGAGYILDSLGWVYFRKGEIDQAVQYLEEAHKRSSGADPEVFEHLGDAYQKKGDLTTAVTYYEKALSLDPERVDVQKKITDLKAQKPE